MVMLAENPSAEAVSAQARSGEIAGEELAERLASLGDLTGIDLSGANLEGASLAGLCLFKANLAGAFLRDADLTDAELTGANLQGASIQGARFVRAGLGMAQLTAVNGFEADFSEATLSGANLEGAALECANLRGARLRETSLVGAGLRGADLREAQLSQSDVREANFDEADLRGARLRAVSGYRSARWYGSDLRDINFTGAYRLYRHVVDENYLREFRESGRLEAVLYRVWRATSDCGRSITRWLMVITGVTLFFALAFAVAGVDTGAHDGSALTHLYYSVVTITTLGYGDVLPNSAVGQVLVMFEVCIGYMLLGGLISIFSNKMARRAS